MVGDWNRLQEAEMERGGGGSGEAFHFEEMSGEPLALWYLITKVAEENMNITYLKLLYSSVNCIGGGYRDRAHNCTGQCMTTIISIASVMIAKNELIH